MSGPEWDLHKVKRMRKRLLIQSNLIFILMLGLFVTYLLNKDYSTLSLLIIFSVLFWVISGNELFKLVKGKTFGTKEAKYVYAFEKDRIGEKQWEQRTWAGFIIVTIVSVVFTVSIFLVDLHSFRIDSIGDLLPFLGVWVGTNIGQIIRMNNL
ncbi:hypothetical protein IMZ31_06165 [Pontibacillus sp. ALD_SL1]|uniref:hypothetical protein n=1 Tax=Pontibacillus sp. ALD_SL1 TaxID=2777185 RepID=UPI001A97AE82|nr:hypothetical protein [Pontibacillus sp. ALD_SL1]QST01144.1 hypothetical protein IMZ31_06165 [Pontibacillus sp. ALD_SL1]